MLSPARGLASGIKPDVYLYVAVLSYMDRNILSMQLIYVRILLDIVLADKR